jgi:hypothetical protein
MVTWKSVPTLHDPPGACEPNEAPQNKVFPIGARCIFKLPADMAGPLLIGFSNRSRPVSVARFVVEMRTAPDSAAADAADAVLGLLAAEPCR